MKTRLIAPLAALALWPAALAQSPSDDVYARLAELEAEVAHLRADSAGHWLTEQRAEEIRGLVQDVLADADTRASLLQSDMTAGYDDGFFLGSADGSFRLNFDGHMQFRYVYNYQDDSPVDDNRSGFENTRTKLAFHGNVVDSTWIYRVEGNFDPDGGSFDLEDAYIGKVLGDSGWIVLAGQLKVPLLREELVDSSMQLAVERSLVNEEFTGNRTQGVALDFRNEVIHFTGAFTDGHPATGGFNSSALERDVEISLTARGEWLIDGSWDTFADLTSRPGAESGWLLGAAIHYQQGEYGTPDPEAEVIQFTFDVSAEFGGWNLFGYYVWRSIDDEVSIDVDQMGFVLQGGVYLNDDWEMYGRFEWGDDDSSADDLSVLTIGANRYFSGHRLKWTTDLGYAFNEVSNTWGDTFAGGGLGADAALTGWRTDSTDSDGQFVFRSQIQLLF
jgi:hypothetical protein